jgi:hypothetical protein
MLHVCSNKRKLHITAYQHFLNFDRDLQERLRSAFSMENKTIYILSREMISNDGSINPVICAFVLVIIIIFLQKITRRLIGVHENISNMPLINGPKLWSFSTAAEKQNFMQNASSLLEEGFKTVSSLYLYDYFILTL